MAYKDRLKEKYVRLEHVRNSRRNIMVDKYLKHVNLRKKNYGQGCKIMNMLQREKNFP